MTIADYQLVMTADAVDASTASLRTVLTTKTSTGGMPGGMPEGMPGGMGMPGPGGTGVAAALKMTGDWVMRFDVARGQLLGIDGKLGVDMSQGPMATIKTSAQLRMKALR